MEDTQSTRTSGQQSSITDIAGIVRAASLLGRVGAPLWAFACGNVLSALPNPLAATGVFVNTVSAGLSPDDRELDSPQVVDVAAFDSTNEAAHGSGEQHVSSRRVVYAQHSHRTGRRWSRYG